MGGRWSDGVVGVWHGRPSGYWRQGSWTAKQKQYEDHRESGRTFSCCTFQFPGIVGAAMMM